MSLNCLSQANAKKIVNDAYLPDESLKYSMYCGWIKGGECILNIKEEMFENKLLYHAVAMAKTIGAADKIYGVKDIFESYFDKQTGLPVKEIRNIKEGNYKYYNEALFNRIKNTVTSLKSGERPAPEYIMDIVSVFYYIRCMDLRKLKYGDKIKSVIFIDNRIFPFQISYHGQEVIKTDMGYINCFKCLPYTEKGTVFKDDDDLTMWFTADDDMIPIRVSIQMWVVTFNCDLVEYKNLRHPLKFSKTNPLK